MITLPVTEEILRMANNICIKKGIPGSIMEGKSNLIGAVGEILVWDYFKKKGHDCYYVPTLDYDLMIDHKRIDVKSKKTSVDPKPNYLCSISSWNTKQDCDYYFFVRVDPARRLGFLLGYMPKDYFFFVAEFAKLGSRDKDGFTFKDDCWNLPVAELINFTA